MNYELRSGKQIEEKSQEEYELSAAAKEEIH